VTLNIPADAYDQPLSLVHRTPAEQRPYWRSRGKTEPPAVAGFRRGFGAFFLEAADDQGRDVHTFKAPLTLTYHFTPQQLRVLNLVAGDLQIFWFDEAHPAARGNGRPAPEAWVSLDTLIDAAAGTATVQIDHFSGYQLSGEASPSEAFLPSIQGWQVSEFTGAATYSLPFDLPVGPGGIKPALELSYNSAATDSTFGQRFKQPSSWVGKGWSLDTGEVALRKIDAGNGTLINTYVLAFGEGVKPTSFSGGIYALHPL
jgi:hypothetical protein